MSVLVTGAAGGIGSATADVLRSAGHDVLTHDLPPTDRSGLDLGGDLCAVEFLDEMSTFLRGVESLDGVILAHGMEGAGTIEDIPERFARKIMAVNFESVVAVWERVAPILERDRGTFTVVVSQTALVSEAGNGVYCASKAMLAGWLRELAPTTSVRLRAVHPGAIDTPLLRRALESTATARGMDYEALIAERYASSPAGRTADPKEIAQALRWGNDLEAPGLVELVINGGEILLR